MLRKIVGIFCADFQLKPYSPLLLSMSTARLEAIDKLFSLDESDPGWDKAHEEFLSAKSADDCVAIAKKHGYNFTKEQFEEYFEQHISPEQLEAVEAGGGCCCCCTC